MMFIMLPHPFILIGSSKVGVMVQILTMSIINHFLLIPLLIKIHDLYLGILNILKGKFAFNLFNNCLVL